MITVTLDYEALIYQGITDAGGQPDDINLLTEDDVKTLGRLAAERGAEQRSPNQPTLALTTLAVPKNGEIFELTFNADDADPIGMVQSDGYSEAYMWKFKGPKVTGTPTRRFKIMSVGHQSNTEAVNKALAEHGTPALGQWREAFRRKYPRHDGEGPIGFTGSEWEDPYRICLFPCVSNGGDTWDSYFYWLNDDVRARWRFVVELT
ncbi:MAG: hypothetical protein Q8P52_02240 [bacterium]|nr:hypothetical protein [bacterium]